MVEQVFKLSFKNRAAVLSGGACGCYFCGHSFLPNDIREWTDGGQTALCPKCSVDSVLSDSQGVPLSEEFMKKAHRYWFAG